MIKKVFLQILATFFLLGSVIEIWSADSFDAYVISNDGAMLRDTPSMNGKIVKKMPYGQAIEVLEELKNIEIISLKNIPFSGVWFHIKSDEHKGYVFSALVAPKFADEFVCGPTNLQKNVEISERDRKIELCVDGSFYLDDSYECKGSCSIHGCWQSKGGSIQISKRKQFRVQGVGKPSRCTHFCEYEKYRVETTVWAMQPYIESSMQNPILEKVTSEENKETPSVRFSPASSACRKSYLFGKPR